jgi:hypothetical protein
VAPPEQPQPRFEWPAIQVPRLTLPAIPRPNFSSRAVRRAAVVIVASMAVFALAILVWPSVRADRTDGERIIAAGAPNAVTSAPSAVTRAPATDTPPVVRASNTLPTAAPPAAVATSGPTDTPAATDAKPAATEGQIVITSEPAGARVTINGVGWGETPLTVRFLPLGTKRLRLTMQGYVSQERVVQIGPERPNARVSVELQPRDASGAAERH